MDKDQLKTKRYMGFTDEKTQRVLDQHFNTYKYRRKYPIDHKFYRGANYDAKSLFINPKKLERRSKDAHSIYYSLMDHLPSYKNYPSRSKSLIFTNSYVEASEYSRKLYNVYPANNAKIAYSPMFSGFIKFPNIKKELGYTLTTFSFRIARLVAVCSVADVITNSNVEDSDVMSYLDKLHSTSYASLENDMNSNDIYNFIKKCDQYVKSEKARESVIKYAVMMDKSLLTYGFAPFTRYFLSGNKSLIETLDDLMNPTKNEIGLATGNEIMDIYPNLPKISEMWTDGFCFLTLNEPDSN